LQYAEDNSGTFPPEHTYSKFKGLVQPYISSTQVFQCPSDSGEDANSTPYYQRRLNNFSSYSINDHPGSCVTYVAPRGITGFSLGQVQSPTRVALVFETVGAFPWSWHDGIGHALNNNRSNMCFVDGHVKYTRMYYENKTPDFTDWGYCYDPPGTANKTSVYEYQWSATP
jgi:prepilin-type processing-associated H-X9-DG protein